MSKVERPRNISSVPGCALGDGGFQVERTNLAWERTVGAIVVCAGAGIRMAAHAGQPLVAGVAALVAFGAVAMLVSGWFTRKRMARRDFKHPAVHNVALRFHVVAVVTSALGMVALSHVVRSM
ncbi:DUF202 domain-containing protein (plasmid) [Rhodococcus qingshengii]|uniref:DUF202 domain-containing protein n=1 Tax=Rhodococcus qingshengii TaxID=334542 RepID=UPI00211229B4|nr:DUF202 domain-containing protein [Rhodococcus qingshengii]UUE28374.1 DUF202 domain-containing protein [Rhodococcus qingshengii]